MRPNYSDKHWNILSIRTDILQRCLQLSLLCLSLCFFLISFATLSSAEAPTTVFLDECKLTLYGHFTYLYSDTNYTVVNSLNNSDNRIYFSAEAEKNLVWKSDTNNGISNASVNTLSGYLSNGYKIKIDFGDTVAVYQPHYYQNYGSQNTRDAWAYYKVNVVDDDVSTELLYRSERSNTVINYLIVGVTLIIVYSIFKMLRRER